MQIIQRKIYIIGLQFKVIIVNGKINDWYFCNAFFLKKWLKEAKNNFCDMVLTIGEGSGLINISWKRISMVKRICLERIDHIEAQTWYKPYSKLHYIRKRIEKLSKETK